MDKKLKILKEKIENLKILIIALKNNIKFKITFENNITNDKNNNLNFNELNNHLEIIKDNYNDSLIFLLQNLNNIIKQYEQNILNINEEINKINSLIVNKYSNHLSFLFNNNNNEINNINNKEYYNLLTYDNFILNYSKLNLKLDFSLYISNPSKLISNINNIYLSLSNLL
jgi:hypothetical protein